MLLAAAWRLQRAEGEPRAADRAPEGWLETFNCLHWPALINAAAAAATADAELRLRIQHISLVIRLEHWIVCLG